MAEVAVGMTCACVGEDGVAELYGALAASLRRIVAGQVTAPEAVIEDACQFAWSTLVRHREHVRRADRAGLAGQDRAARGVQADPRGAPGAVARRALRACRRPLAPCHGRVTPSVEEQVEQRARLASLGSCPSASSESSGCRAWGSATPRWPAAPVRAGGRSSVSSCARSGRCARARTDPTVHRRRTPTGQRRRVTRQLPLGAAALAPAPLGGAQLARLGLGLGARARGRRGRGRHRRRRCGPGPGGGRRAR